MRAIAVDGFGTAATLHDLPIPEARDGEILLRVRSSSVNGFDVAVLNGHLKGIMEHHFPVVLGKDLAGTVEAAGAGVGHLRPGDTAFGVLMGPVLGPGAFGEHAAAPAAFLAHVPDGLDLVTAGALGLAGTTALNAVDAVHPAEGETVLVSGATGGVGAFAVQLASARGARVIATASTSAGEVFVRGLGAEAVVDHRDDLSAAVRSLQPDGVDAVLHLAGDAAGLVALCAPGGRLASTLGFAGDQSGRDDVQVTSIVAAPTTATLEQLAAAVAAGDLVVPIQRIYALEDVPQALADFGAGTRGKLAISIS